MHRHGAGAEGKKCCNWKPEKMCDKFPAESFATTLSNIFVWQMFVQHSPLIVNRLRQCLRLFCRSPSCAHKQCNVHKYRPNDSFSHSQMLEIPKCRPEQKRQNNIYDPYICASFTQWFHFISYLILSSRFPYLFASIRYSFVNSSNQIVVCIQIQCLFSIWYNYFCIKLS